ncbi:MAG: DMT family transporter [Chloroflexi bacterium]|nr:DMT family transporter [Chloroflexota bacterium]
MPLLGELAALGTAICWSFTSTFFTMAGRMVGSVVVNRIRLLLAILFLSLSHRLLLGTWFPQGVAFENWWWLAISGVIGLSIGDALLFQAFVVIGARLSMLLMSLVPVISTLLAWLFLNETLTSLQLLAVFVTVFGVAWVILDRTPQNGQQTPAQFNWLGIMFGLGGALGQALGLIAAKKGLSNDFSPLSGTLIRMVAAAAALWLATIVTGKTKSTFQQLFSTPKSFIHILGGSFFGPFLGVTLSLVAVQATAVGIASTIIALPPIFLLPIGYFVFQERVGWRAVAGTVVALSGVAILLLWG